MVIPTLKIHWPSFGIGVGVMVGIAVALFFVYGQTLEKNPDSAQVQSDTQAALDLITANASPELGSKDAPITMVEFGDYQCYYCNQFYHKTESDIVKNYIDTGKVRLIFKDFTIIGQDSVNAAHASHCAQEQGKFWQYHDALYNNWAGENTGWASSGNLLTFAKQEGLDTNQFSQCMSESRYVKVIQGSVSNAKDLGLTGTPDFFIFGADHSVSKVVGAQPYEVFDEIFKSKLKS